MHTIVGFYKILAAEHYAAHPTEINRPEECAILFNKYQFFICNSNKTYYELFFVSLLHYISSL